jgi:hypothetical protein
MVNRGFIASSRRLSMHFFVADGLRRLLLPARTAVKAEMLSIGAIAKTLSWPCNYWRIRSVISLLSFPVIENNARVPPTDWLMEDGWTNLTFPLLNQVGESD